MNAGCFNANGLPWSLRSMQQSLVRAIKRRKVRTKTEIIMVEHKI